MSFISDYLREQLAPYMTEDLGTYMDTIAAMYDELDAYAGLDLEEEGWGALLDPDLCPAAGLPYLAQFIGEVIPDGLDETASRLWIVDHPNQRRGTVAGIVAAVQRVLTGTRLVAIREQDTGHPDYIAIRTLLAQTPSTELVKQELLNTVPADIVVDYTTFAGSTWTDIDTARLDWAAVKAAYVDWAAVTATLSGYTIYALP